MISGPGVRSQPVGRSGLPWHHAPRGAGTRRATPQGWGPPCAHHTTRALLRSASIDERVRR